MIFLFNEGKISIPASEPVVCSSDIIVLSRRARVNGTFILICQG